MKKKKVKVKKTKPKVKKAKPKAKAKSTPERAIIEVAKLELVEYAFGNLEKKLYDLSINIEGEHDHICKTIQRCHDRIEHVEGLVMQLSQKLDGVGFYHRRLAEKLDMLEGVIKNAQANAKEFMDSSSWGRMPKFSEVRADAEDRIREALKDLEKHDDDPKSDHDEDLR